MSEQRLHDNLSDQLRLRAGGDDAGTSADNLAAARDELGQIFATADAILDRIRQGNSARFLEQTRQSSGQ